MTTATPTKIRTIIPVKAAALIRAELKAVFPKVKFSVTVQRFSNGANIMVRYTDKKIPRADVLALTTPFKGYRFDGMTDNRYAVATVLNDETIHSEVNHVFVENDAFENWGGYR